MSPIESTVTGRRGATPVHGWCELFRRLGGWLTGRLVTSTRATYQLTIRIWIVLLLLALLSAIWGTWIAFTVKRRLLGILRWSR